MEASLDCGGFAAYIRGQTFKVIDMPILTNPRYERFAQALAAGKSADEAYVLAGFRKNRGNAIRLKANESIVARVEELQARASASLEITLEWLIEKANEAREKAMELGQTAAAVSAVKELGILSGKRVEKREHLSRTLDQMSDAELMSIARGEASTCH